MLKNNFNDISHSKKSIIIIYVFIYFIYTYKIHYYIESM